MMTKQEILNTFVSLSNLERVAEKAKSTQDQDIIYGGDLYQYTDLLDLIEEYKTSQDIVEYPASLFCWHCDEELTYIKRLDNDGFCTHCEAEIYLD